jgi:hypothetical protein
MRSRVKGSAARVRAGSMVRVYSARNPLTRRRSAVASCPGCAYIHTPAQQEDRMVRDFFGMIAGIPRRGVQCLGINSRESNAYECLPG